jgi:hypothetical protein
MLVTLDAIPDTIASRIAVGFADLEQSGTAPGLAVVSWDVVDAGSWMS